MASASETGNEQPALSIEPAAPGSRACARPLSRRNWLHLYVFLALRGEGEQRLGAKRWALLIGLSVATVAQWQQCVYVVGAMHSTAPNEHRRLTNDGIHKALRLKADRLA